ncbi:hypothetical protein B0J12DRAFT_705659 [Macrophomina phaseolina]|uniref:Uncharacterized protein n=1 Tax=Macrophomina phaseolina TaxID=35725 RepID=A0ABQ8FRY5_9PEZI|nr:hypothetical protein B0J12DRAFT_705659 [Macrophomina phaseolina]
MTSFPADHDIDSRKRQRYRGTVRVDIESLSFASHLRQDKIQPAGYYRPHQEYRLEPHNHIPVSIDDLTLRRCLQATGLRRKDLLNNTRSGYHFLAVPPDLRLCCLRGWAQVAAAKNYYSDPQDRWWIVDLYDIGTDQKLKHYLADQHWRAERLNDGEIIQKAYDYGIDAERQHVLSALGPTAQKLFKTLSTKTENRKLYDALLRYLDHTLRRGNETLSYTDTVALTMKKELSCYLDVVVYIWTRIACGKEDWLMRIDSATVKALEGKAPRCSRADRGRLQFLIRKQKIFVNFSKEERQLISQGLEYLPPMIILTQHTFFRDAKNLLKPWSACLKWLLPPLSRKSPDLFSALAENFTATNSVEVQISEMRFEKRACDKVDAYRLAYLQLFIFAIRHWTHIPTKPVKKDSKAKPKARVNQTVLRAYGDLASRLGYYTEEIQRLLELPASTIPDTVVGEPQFVTGEDGPSLRHRSGGATADEHEHDKAFTFWDNLKGADVDNDEDVTSFFVLACQFYAFFKCRISKEMIGASRLSDGPPSDHDGSASSPSPFSTIGADSEGTQRSSGSSVSRGESYYYDTFSEQGLKMSPRQNGNAPKQSPWTHEGQSLQAGEVRLGLHQRHLPESRPRTRRYLSTESLLGTSMAVSRETSTTVPGSHTTEGQSSALFEPCLDLPTGDPLHDISDGIRSYSADDLGPSNDEAAPLVTHTSEAPSEQLNKEQEQQSLTTTEYVQCHPLAPPHEVTDPGTRHTPHGSRDSVDNNADVACILASPALDYPGCDDEMFDASTILEEGHQDVPQPSTSLLSAEPRLDHIQGQTTYCHELITVAQQEQESPVSFPSPLRGEAEHYIIFGPLYAENLFPLFLQAQTARARMNWSREPKSMPGRDICMVGAESSECIRMIEAPAVLPNGPPTHITASQSPLYGIPAAQATATGYTSSGLITTGRLNAFTALPRPPDSSEPPQQPETGSSPMQQEHGNFDVHVLGSRAQDWHYSEDSRDEDCHTMRGNDAHEINERSALDRQMAANECVAVSTRSQSLSVALALPENEEAPSCATPHLLDAGSGRLVPRGLLEWTENFEEEASIHPHLHLTPDGQEDESRRVSDAFTSISGGSLAHAPSFPIHRERENEGAPVSPFDSNSALTLRAAQGSEEAFSNSPFPLNLVTRDDSEHNIIRQSSATVASEYSLQPENISCSTVASNEQGDLKENPVSEPAKNTHDQELPLASLTFNEEKYNRARESHTDPFPGQRDFVNDLFDDISVTQVSEIRDEHPDESEENFHYQDSVQFSGSVENIMPRHTPQANKDQLPECDLPVDSSAHPTAPSTYAADILNEQSRGETMALHNDLVSGDDSDEKGLRPVAMPEACQPPSAAPGLAAEAHLLADTPYDIPLDAHDGQVADQEIAFTRASTAVPNMHQTATAATSPTEGATHKGRNRNIYILIANDQFRHERSSDQAIVQDAQKYCREGQALFVISREASRPKLYSVLPEDIHISLWSRMSPWLIVRDRRSIDGVDSDFVAQITNYMEQVPYKTILKREADPAWDEDLDLRRPTKWPRKDQNSKQDPFIELQASALQQAEQGGTSSVRQADETTEEPRENIEQEEEGERGMREEEQREEKEGEEEKKNYKQNEQEEGVEEREEEEEEREQGEREEEEEEERGQGEREEEEKEQEEREQGEREQEQSRDFSFVAPITDYIEPTPYTNTLKRKASPTWDEDLNLIRPTKWPRVDHNGNQELYFGQREHEEIEQEEEEHKREEVERAHEESEHKDRREEEREHEKRKEEGGEQERIEQERREQERIEQERREQERIEQERREQERREQKESEYEREKEEERKQKERGQEEGEHEITDYVESASYINTLKRKAIPTGDEDLDLRRPTKWPRRDQNGKQDLFLELQASALQQGGTSSVGQADETTEETRENIGREEEGEKETPDNRKRRRWGTYGLLPSRLNPDGSESS